MNASSLLLPPSLPSSSLPHIIIFVVSLSSTRFYLPLLKPNVCFFIHPSPFLLLPSFSFSASFHLSSSLFFLLTDLRLLLTTPSIHLIPSIHFSNRWEYTLSIFIGMYWPSPSLHCSLSPPLPCSHIDDSPIIQVYLTRAVTPPSPHPPSIFSSFCLLCVCVCGPHAPPATAANPISQMSRPQRRGKHNDNTSVSLTHTPLRCRCSLSVCVMWELECLGCAIWKLAGERVVSCVQVCFSTVCVFMSEWQKVKTVAVENSLLLKMYIQGGCKSIF